MSTIHETFDMDAFDKAWDAFHAAMKPLSDRIGFTSFKHYKSMSEETMCFNANITFDGKNIGYAKNDGHGGETSIYFDDPAMWGYLNAEIRRIWDGDPKDILGLETFISSLAAAFAEDKDWAAYAKRVLKRGGTAFRCAKVERPTHTYQFATLNSRNPASVQKARDEITSQGFVIMAEA
jgi:hypothetical protein